MAKKQYRTDENGDTWDEDGNLVETESQSGSLMDRLNRRIHGEELPPLEEK